MAIFKNRAKQLLTQIDEHKKRHAELLQEREQIELDRYENRVDRNRLATLDTNRVILELEKELSQIKAQHPLPSRVEATRAEKAEMLRKGLGIRREAFAHGVGLALDRFIVADPEAVFGKEYRDAQARLEQLLERKNNLGPNQSVGPRLRQEIHEAEAIIAQWPRTEKTCEFGRRLYEIDQQIEALQKEENVLLAQWEEESLAAAVA